MELWFFMYVCMSRQLQKADGWKEFKSLIVENLLFGPKVVLLCKSEMKSDALHF